jgi:hypothetical protein
MGWWCRSFVMVAALAGCQTFAGGGGGGGGDDDSTSDARGSGSGSGGGTDVFATSTTKVVVEIDYEMGQQPYTGNQVGFGETFAPTLTNIDRLFSGKKMVTIPTTIPNMQNIGAVSDEEITVADIAALSMAHRDQHDTADTKTYWMIFLSGHFADGNGVQAQVLGVSIGDTVAMFKDVIKSTSSTLSPNTAVYVEQSTLIHELAHSIGLVDNGVPMVATHKDATHGAHCNNPDCVMYWLNEGASDASDFALRRLLTGDTLLFDAACLADVDALTGGP